MQANLTKDGILSLEKGTNLNNHSTTAELDLSEKNRRLRFSIDENGNITKIISEKTEGFEQRPTLEIHIIHGSFSKRTEIKPGTREFSEAINLLDENLETFRLPLKHSSINSNQELQEWLKEI